MRICPVPDWWMSTWWLPLAMPSVRFLAASTSSVSSTALPSTRRVSRMPTRVLPPDSTAFSNPGTRRRRKSAHCQTWANNSESAALTCSVFTPSTAPTRVELMQTSRRAVEVGWIMIRAVGYISRSAMALPRNGPSPRRKMQGWPWRRISSAISRSVRPPRMASLSPSARFSGAAQAKSSSGAVSTLAMRNIIETGWRLAASSVSWKRAPANAQTSPSPEQSSITRARISVRPDLFRTTRPSTRSPVRTTSSTKLCRSSSTPASASSRETAIFVISGSQQ